MQPSSTMPFPFHDYELICKPKQNPIDQNSKPKPIAKHKLLNRNDILRGPNQRYVRQVAVRERKQTHQNDENVIRMD